MVKKQGKNKKQESKDMEEEHEKDIAESLEQITPFIEALAPRLIEYQKIREPIIKRGQWINFIVMMTILLSVSILAFYKVIDGSAVTGLIGVVIGYVFGSLYQQRIK